MRSLKPMLPTPGNYSSDRQRDIFPLPTVSRPVRSVVSHLSRGCQQRVRKRDFLERSVDEVCIALNDVFADSDVSCMPLTTEGPRPLPITAAQSRARTEIARVLDCVAEPAAKLGAHEASRVLLQTSLDYHGSEAVSSVRPYDRALLSLPKVGHLAPAASDLLGPAEAAVVRDFPSHMLLSPDQWEQVLETQPNIKPYMDHQLKNDSDVFHQFIADLFFSNLLGFTNTPTDIVTPFFVEKRGKASIRLVFDCRVPNRRFRQSPPMEMSSGTSWSRLELQPHQKLYIGQCDIKDCFYNISIPDLLGEFFSLPPVSVSRLIALGIPQAAFSSLDRTVAVFPFLRRLPMGFSWAFWIVQRIAEYQTSRALGGDSRLQLTDHGPLPDLDSGSFLVTYCDNVNVAGSCKETVQRDLTRVIDHLTGLGLPMHDIVPPATRVKSLGYVIDGAAGTVEPDAQKLHMLRQTARHLSTRPRVGRKAIEKFLGHFVHLALLHRGLLALPRALYDFAAASDQPRRLWPSAARECKWIETLLVFARTDLRLAWHGKVTMSDASPSGIGVCQSWTGEFFPADLGRTSERWRYLPDCPQKNPRSVLSGDPFSDISTVQRTQDDPGLAEFKVNVDFPEISKLNLDAHAWQVCFARRVRGTQPIGNLEAKGVVAAFRHLLRAISGFRKRLLNLGDNLGIQLMFSKGRGCNFCQLVACRRLFCLEAASGSRCHHRWLPSEWNLADEPSRIWEPAKQASGRSESGHQRLSSSGLANGKNRDFQDGHAASYGKESTTGCPGTAGGPANSGHRPPHHIADASQHDSRRRGSASPTGSPSEASGEAPRRVSAAGRPGYCRVHGEQRRVQRDAAEVPVVDRPILAFLPAARTRAREPRAGGHGLCGVRRLPLFRRAGLERVHLVDRGVHGLEPQVLSCRGSPLASSPSGRPGIQQIGASPYQAANYMERAVSHRPPDRAKWGPPGLPPPDRHVHLLLPPGGGLHDQGGRRRPTARQLHVHGVERLPTGARGAQQDAAQGCVPPLRRPLCEVSQRCHRSGGQSSSEQGAFWLQLPPGQNPFREGPRPAQTPGEVCAVPGSTWRTQPRSRVSGAIRARDQGARAVGKRSLSPPLRKPRAPSTSGSKITEPPGQVGHRRPSPPRETDPVLHGVDHRGLGGARLSFDRAQKWCLEVFSGSCHLASALSREGFQVECWDIVDNPKNSLLDQSVVSYLAECIAGRHICFLHFGLPCGTWSRARRNDGRGPGPLRDDDKFLYGLPKLSEKDCCKVRDANRLLRTVAGLCRLAIKYKIPFVIENPQSSRVWLSQEVRNLRKLGARSDLLSMCQYGTPWKKNTILLSHGVPAFDPPLCVCHSSRGLCSLSGKPHLHLSGKSKGVFATAAAQVYPNKLCRDLARHLVSKLPGQEHK